MLGISIDHGRSVRNKFLFRISDLAKQWSSGIVRRNVHFRQMIWEADNAGFVTDAKAGKHSGFAVIDFESNHANGKPTS